MEVMTERINRAELTTKEMLSKYDESAKSAVNIETVVGHLMEELGVGGFMGVQDIRPSMKIAIAFKGTNADKRDYIGEVADCVDKNIYVTLEENISDILTQKEKHTLCQLRIVVDNVLYSWDDIEISHAQNGRYKLTVETNPQVFNRRKYPRMPLSNSCSIKIKGNDISYHGRMVNISANGFAFASRESLFSNIKGQDVVLDITDFDLLKGRSVEGCIIRTSNNGGEYIIGCRMPQDNAILKEYISKNYSE